MALDTPTFLIVFAVTVVLVGFVTWLNFYLAKKKEKET
jgi:hypothetical protein